MHLHSIHHCAVICTNYERSKQFYVSVLGLKVIHETYRQERDSYKLDLAVGDSGAQIELFSFPNPPKRPTHPEASGLRHLAFAVQDIEASVHMLSAKGVATEAIRVDPFTKKRFTFFRDPDDLPLELYEL